MEKGSIIKNGLSKILHGFLFGIGFSLILSASYYYVSELMVSDLESSYDIENMVLLDHREVVRNSTTYVLGTIENQGEFQTKNINIEVDLFDKKGIFVEKCSGLVSGVINPKEKRNFKITCGCKDKPTVEHESYKINIINAW